MLKRFTNQKMKVKVQNSITLKNYSDHIIDICCENATINIYDYTKIRELIFQMYKVHEEESDENQPTCFIEIIIKQQGSYVFEYPFALRQMAFESYSMLVDQLKWHMQDRENINQI